MSKKPGRGTQRRAIRRRVDAILAGRKTYEHQKVQSYALEIVRWMQNRGACFDVALNIVRLAQYDDVLKGAKLVHGIVPNAHGAAIVHAWVEVGSICVDLTKPAGHERYVAPRKTYYKDNVFSARTYTREQALRHFRTAHSAGPWEPSFDKLQNWNHAIWRMMYRTGRWEKSGDSPADLQDLLEDA